MNSNSNDRASQNSEAEPTASAAFRTSYPIDYSLEDEEGKSVLYIDDASEVHNHSLCLKVSNTSGRNIELINDKTWSEASEQYHHFELIFRPGVLDDYDKITLKESADWSLRNKQQPDGTISLYFLCKTEKYTLNFKEVALTLQQVKASARGGARGTQVELKYKHLKYQGDQENFSGNRLQNLSIINHYGRKDIPLHVGFISGDDILNDGITLNELHLRIANTTLKEVSLKPIDSGVSPKFIISFDTGDAGTNPWALGTNDQVKEIRVEVNYRLNGSKLESVSRSSNENISPQWEINIPSYLQQLEPGQFFEIKLYDIITSHPSGYTNLYLRYENIPGYWDGQFVCSIEKTPLLYRGNTIQAHNTIYVQSNGTEPTLQVKQKGVGLLASFMQLGEGDGVKITGIKGKNNALYISNNETDNSTLYVSNKGLGETLYVEQKGSGYAARFKGKIDVQGDISCSGDISLSGGIRFKDKIDVQGDISCSGGISCGGKIAIKSFKGGYLSHLDGNDGTEAKFQPHLREYEQMTIQMVCSREFKENISSLSPEEAIRTLAQLTAVKYDYKNELAFRQNIGFIAEDMPENLASEDRKTISPFEIIPILTTAIQSLQKKIAELEIRLTDLTQEK